MSRKSFDVVKRLYSLIPVIGGLMFLWIVLGPRGAHVSTMVRMGAVFWISVAIISGLFFAFEKGNIFVEIRNKTLSDRKRMVLAILCLAFALSSAMFLLLPAQGTRSQHTNLLTAAIFFGACGIMVLLRKPRG